MNKPSESGGDQPATNTNGVASHEAGEPPPRKRFRLPRRLWIVGLALYCGAVWYFGWDKFVAAAANAAPWMPPALAGLAAVSVWSRAWKWRIALGPRADAVRLYFLSKVGGQYSPGRVGELAPLLLRKYRTPRIAAWIVLDRLLEMAATLVLGFIGLLLIQTGLSSLLPAILVGAALIVALPAYAVTRTGLFLGVCRRTREGSLMHRGAAMLAATSHEILGFRSRIPWFAVVTVGATVVDAALGVVLFAGMGHPVGLAVFFLVMCAHAFTAVIPITPAATGIPHAAAAVLLNRLAGLPFDVYVAALGISLVVQNLVFWSSFGIGIGSRRNGDDA